MPVDDKILTQRALLRGAVAREIFCARSQAVLDVRTSVLVTITHNSGSSTDFALLGSEWDKIKDNTALLVQKGRLRSFTVIDGRVINRKPTPTGKKSGK